MNFNMHQSVKETEYYLDSFITRESLKLADNISNQFDHQYYSFFLLIISEIRK